MEVTKAVAVAVVLLLAAAGGLMALSLCDISEDGLLACKPSVTQPSPADPSAECCQALYGANMTCLCGYKNSLVLPALGIDPALALALPAKCNLTAPADC
ncbi:hypothetical protein NMG60_11034437 [Bertholletia excelsa]